MQERVQPPVPPGTVAEVARLALRLGFTAFGGPAAHIAMLRDEVVTRRKWLDDAHFLDLLGATNLIPGPNSTEMVIHVGQVRAGWRGMIAGGVCFILPAALMVLALAWAYAEFGAMPAANWLLYGIKPVIIAIVLQALWGLAKTAVKGPWLAALGLAVLALYLLGFDELALLFGSGLLVMLARNFARLGRRGAAALLPIGAAPWLAQAAVPVSLAQLFLSFLKIGAVLYGSGYVLLAFMRSEFVVRLGWLSDQQLLDAIAIGQFTPGPVFTTATFVGYLVAGAPGAALATVGIFLPSFVFVAAVNPLIPLLRRSPWMGGFLDGVNVAALGLMAAVLWELGRAAVVDWPTALLAAAAAVLLFRFKINSAWLVLAGGAAGLLLRWLLPGGLP
ncbi:chromate efflux transporter [Kouleothrix sp.]|uniref:chromate efflux transporter n=1 Tax=Kouleothrix sp. TaxID=2779161 RepID=UPI00391A0DBF